MWVCHISRWAWDTGGRAPNVGMPHQQMGMGHVFSWRAWFATTTWGRMEVELTWA